MATKNAVNTSLSGQTGTGSFAGSTSPSFTTPAIGTPSSGTLTNCTALPVPGGLSATGTPSSTTFLRGDGSWSAPGGGTVTAAQVQQSAFNHATSTGISDNFAVTLSPAVVSLTDGLLISMLPHLNNTTGTPTLNVNGLGALEIRTNYFLPEIAVGDIIGGLTAFFIYSASNAAFILLNPQISYAFASDVLSGGNYWVSNDGGSAANDYVVAMNVVSSFPTNDIAPLFIVMKFTNASNTGPSVMTIWEIAGTFNILDCNGGALIGGEMLVGKTYFFFYNGSNYLLLNSELTQLQSKPLITTPPASQDATLALGVAYQNVLGYDVVLTVYVAVATATTADFLLGVDNNATPTQQTIVSGLSLLALNIIPITIYLPNNYYALLSTSGTISATISGQQVMPV